MRAGEAAEAQSASEPASTPAPTRSVTLQCRRVLFGPGTGGILPLPDLQTDVPLILDDKESDCPARRERRLTFRCRATVSRLLYTREVFSADVERVQIYDAAEARPSHINGPVIVLWMTATYADRGGSHRPFAPATLIVSQLEHDFDREAFSLLRDDAFFTEKSVESISLAEAHEHFMSVELASIRAQQQAQQQDMMKVKGLDEREEALNRRKACLDRREADLMKWEEQLKSQWWMNHDVERMLSDGIGRQLMPEVQHEFIMTYSDHFQRELAHMKPAVNYGSVTVATQTEANVAPPPPPPPPEPSALGKRPAPAPDHENTVPLEPLLRAGLGSRQLGRDRARAYLKAMGASQFGPADQLRERIRKLFDANNIDQYHPGITRLSVTKVDE